MMTRRISVLAMATLLPLLGAGTLSGQAGAELESGIRAYTEQGDAREAIRRIGTALDGGSVSASARPRAHVYMAHAFLALGDTVSALPHIQRALAAEPCLLPAGEHAPPGWIELYERNRQAGVRCNSRAVSVTLQSMILPGWGQRSLGREGTPRYFLAATLGAAAGSVYYLRSGERSYADYQSSTSYPELITLYDQAQGARRRGVVLGGAAAAVYLLNVADALSAGLAHDRTLARVRPLAVMPSIHPTSTGAAFALTIKVR